MQITFASKVITSQLIYHDIMMRLLPYKLKFKNKMRECKKCKLS